MISMHLLFSITVFFIIFFINHQVFVGLELNCCFPAGAIVQFYELWQSKKVPAYVALRSTVNILNSRSTPITTEETNALSRKQLHFKTKPGLRKRQVTRANATLILRDFWNLSLVFALRQHIPLIVEWTFSIT